MNKSLETKTINEWMNEARSQTHSFHDKYENCFNVVNCPIEMFEFYRKCKTTYADLYEVLKHLNSYNTLIDKINCKSCQRMESHTERLERNFLKLYPLIMRCKDGFRFKDLRKDIKLEKYSRMVKSNN